MRAFNSHHHHLPERISLSRQQLAAFFLRRPELVLTARNESASKTGQILIRLGTRLIVLEPLDCMK
jgi:hypothetical protein